MDGEIIVGVSERAIRTESGFIKRWDSRESRNRNNEWKDELKRLTDMVRFIWTGELQPYGTAVTCMMFFLLGGILSPCFTST